MKKDLSECPPFGEVELHKLPDQGYSNTNYRFTYEGKAYLLREFGLKDRDREMEFYLQQLAHEAGIAPKPYCLTLTYMVSDFIEGTHKTNVCEEEIIRLAKALQEIHAISPSQPVPQIDLHGVIQSREMHVIESFNIIARYPKETVLCHNDLNPQNLLWTNDSLQVIDWEFAGLNDRYFDLAAVCVEFGLDEKMQKVFLEAYFEGEDFTVEKLEACKVLYEQVCDEWFEKL